MSGGISKLGAALIAIFVLCLAAVIADIIYVLWRRRSFNRQSASAEETVIGGDSVYDLSSKELLYLFCWKNNSRIEPNGQSRQKKNDESSEGDEFLKLQDAVYDQRKLFTIKEEETEEREGLDLEALPLDSSEEKDREEGSEVLEMALTVDETEVEELTPFTTPCASPPYYTPSPSPTREEIKKLTENSVCDGEMVEFVTVGIDGV